MTKIEKHTVNIKGGYYAKMVSGTCFKEIILQGNGNNNTGQTMNEQTLEGLNEFLGKTLVFDGKIEGVHGVGIGYVDNKKGLHIHVNNKKVIGRVKDYLKEIGADDYPIKFEVGPQARLL